MMNSRSHRAYGASIAGIAALWLFSAPAAADLAFDVSVAAYASTRAGIGGGLRGWGTIWGPEWIQSGSLGLASAAFDSSVTCCDTPDIHGNIAPGAASAHVDLRATAAMGWLSGAANANVATTAPIDFPGWGHYVEAYATVGLSWADTMTVTGVNVGMPVTVRMTVTLEDSIGSAYSGEGLNASYGATVHAGLTAETSQVDAETGELQTANIDIGDGSGGPAGYPQRRSTEFSELVGVPFDMNGYLTFIVRDTLNNGGIADGIWASSFVDASHTMKGYVEIVDPLPGQILSSASGHDYAATVPEPRSWALMLGGLALLAFAAARRKTSPR